MKGSWRELVLAAQDSVRADCRRHRERAKARLAKALDGIRHQERPDARDALLRRLVDYAAEFPEDPIAAECLRDAASLGITSFLPDSEGTAGPGEHS